LIVEIVPMGEINADILRDLPPLIVGIYRPLVEDCRVGKALEMPPPAHDPERKQYRADAVLEHVQNSVEAPEVSIILAIVGVDLYSPGLNFVFGKAQCPGNFAIVSLHRLDPIFYGGDHNDDLLLERATKEAVHELGHSLGLGHCSNPECVMSFSNSIMDVNGKKSDFCESCRGRLEL
jgi:archaemetzincin